MITTSNIIILFDYRLNEWLQNGIFFKKSLDFDYTTQYNLWWQNVIKGGRTLKVTLTDLRLSKNLTQRQLAHELSLSGTKFSQSAIALYEAGLRNPSIKRAVIIARYFNVPVESIFFTSFDYEMQSTRTEGGN